MSTAVSASTSHWLNYMDTRRGTYAFRANTRYRCVADELLGLKDKHLLVDVGAGSCHFGHYLSAERGWRGRYLPVDAVLDGTDLETWEPRMHADYFTVIEVLEHLRDPWRLMDVLEKMVNRRIVATTPNPDVIDVLACDPTHVTPISLQQFWQRGWRARPCSLFGIKDDSIVAYIGRTNL
jgi:hypothetical protein